MTKAHRGAGITLTMTSMTLSSPGATRPAISRTTLEPPLENGAWPALATALRESGAAEAGGGRLSVALTSPLVEVRRLAFPAKMPLDQIELIIARTPNKYFVTARGGQSIGVSPLSGHHDGQQMVLAAAMNTRLLNGIHAAARDAGCSVKLITPIESAWTAAGVNLWPALSKKVAHLLISQEDRTVLLELSGGKLQNVRRFRAGDVDADLIAETIRGSLGSGELSTVGGIGIVAGQSDLARALAPRGVPISAAPGDWADVAVEPDAAAAAYAGGSAGPLVQSDAVRAKRNVSLQKLVYAAAGVAFLLFCAAGALLYSGAKQELSELASQREALAPRVMETVVGQNTVEEVYSKVAALKLAERTAPHWSSVLIAMTDYVPADAYLTAFRVKGDSLWVEGVADRAARVFDSIDRSGLVSAIYSPNPVRLQAEGEGESVERFTINAVLRDSTRTVADSIALAPKPAARSGRGVAR